MFEAFLLFMTTWFVTWPVLVILFLAGVWCEYRESRASAVFWALVAAVIAFFYFKVPLLELAMYAGAYLVIGVLWSFYRYKRFIVDKVENMTEINYTMDKVSYYHPSKMLDTITAWIIIWPFSLTENLCGDIISGIETLVKKVFKGAYTRIYENATKQLNKVDR